MSRGFEIRRQCPDCPWRTDAPPGAFPASRYEDLFRSCVAEEGAIMACHHTSEGAEAACVGFLAAEGENLALPRLMRSQGEWDPAELELAPCPQCETFGAMAAANGADVDRQIACHNKLPLLYALRRVAR